MLVAAVHKTDRDSALSILKSGFDLGKFGSATEKTGQSLMFGRHPKGVYLTVDSGEFNPRDHASHPWDHRDRGVLVFCNVRMEHPLVTELRVEGRHYHEWLSDKYGGLIKEELTRAIMKDGYDSVFCPAPGEIIAFDPSQIRINEEKTKESINSHSKWKLGFGEWIKSF